MSNYIRTKTEYLETITILEKENGVGNFYRLPLIRLHQNPSYSMFTTKMRTDACHLLLQRVPRDYNNPDGIQRAFKNDKIAGINTAAQTGSYTVPGSMIMTVQVKDHPYVHLEVGDKQEQGFLNVDLSQIRSLLEKSKTNENDVIIDESVFKIGYMIDAHHRTEGHYQAGKMGLEMAATCYINLARSEMASVFANVNEHQDKPSPTHTIAMRSMAGMLEGGEKEAVQIAVTSNNNSASILYQRIKEFDGRVPKGSLPTYVNLKTISVLMKNFIVFFIPQLTIMQKENIVDSYFRGWSETFPEAWQDEKKHVLVKAMGFTLMCRLFEKIYNIAVDHNSNSTPNSAEFSQVLKVAFKDKPLSVDPQVFGGQREMELDWSSEKFGAYSSGKGINALAIALIKHIVDHRTEILEDLKP